MIHRLLQRRRTGRLTIDRQDIAVTLDKHVIDPGMNRIGRKPVREFICERTPHGALVIRIGANDSFWDRKSRGSATFDAVDAFEGAPAAIRRFAASWAAIPPAALPTA
ncbi:hypothetical protein AB4212_31560, partial [Streptomyces sp. 2MCAF27]